MGLLDQLVRMAGEAVEQRRRKSSSGVRGDSISGIPGHSKEEGFPDIELQWMAAVCFNHGLDLYGAGESERCHAWADRALNLAEFMDDGGAMREDLQAKLMMLKW